VPYRLLVDSMRREWQVWDIVPRLMERRSGDDTERRLAEAQIEFPDRRAEGRRLTQARRTVLRGSYASGWLCFESLNEKRRLSPIPDDWTTCSDALLERYLAHGEPVTSAHRSVVVYSDEGPMAEAG
jgi:hypothetical protein